MVYIVILPNSISKYFLGSPAVHSKDNKHNIWQKQGYNTQPNMKPQYRKIKDQSAYNKLKNYKVLQCADQHVPGIHDVYINLKENINNISATYCCLSHNLLRH